MYWLTPGSFWISIRLAGLAMAVLAGLSPYSGKTNVNWQLGIVCGLVFAAGFSFAVQVIWPKRGADLSMPWSPSAPFWPMNKYPIRSWLLSAVCIGVLGLVGRAREGLAGDNVNSVGSANSVYECMIVTASILLASIIYWGWRLNKSVKQPS